MYVGGERETDKERERWKWSCVFIMGQGCVKLIKRWTSVDINFNIGSDEVKLVN